MDKLTEKKRKNLSQPKPKKKKSFLGSMFGGDVSAISKRRKLMEESLKY